MIYYNTEFLKFGFFNEENKNSTDHLSKQLDDHKTTILNDVCDTFFTDKEKINIESQESSEGSDNEPSIDNLDEDDLKKLLPTKSKVQSNK